MRRSATGSGVAANLRALVESKRTGVYDWTPEGETYVPDEVLALFSVGDRPSSAEQVRERALRAVAEEIGLMLAEGVVAAPMDIDLCLILGAGWPFHLGGITPYLDRTGISERVLGRRFLPPGVASVAGSNSDLALAVSNVAFDLRAARRK